MVTTSSNHSIVFWDTSAFVAILLTRDKYHQQAIRIQHELHERRTPIFTTDAVLTELANGLANPRIRSEVVTLIDDLLADAASGKAKLIRTDRSLWEKGWHLYRNRPDQSWALTDCISFVVMHEHNVQRAFTADKHFEQAGFIRLMTDEES